MIQLPSKIRTTLFNASVEFEPSQLFSHENDRLAVIIYNTGSFPTYPSFGRSSQDALNSDYLQAFATTPLFFYGPEPLWMVLSKNSGVTTVSFVLVHAIYHA